MGSLILNLNIANQYLKPYKSANFTESHQLIASWVLHAASAAA